MNNNTTTENSLKTLEQKIKNIIFEAEKDLKALVDKSDSKDK
jgi:hypothetical protein